MVAGQYAEQGPLFSKRLRTVYVGRIESMRNLDDFSSPFT